MPKHSLRHLDHSEDLQTVVTNQAMIFAELTLKAARENKLTREQIIKETHVDQSNIRTVITQTRHSR